MRLGVDKMRLTLGRGRTLLQQVVDSLAEVCQEVILVGGHAYEEVPAGARAVPDVYPGTGSLGGIYSGLLAATYSHSLAVACDMPFLCRPLLKYMVERDREYDVLIPCMGDHLEPLHAIYSKQCLGPIQGVLDRGHLKILDFFDQVRVRHLEEAEVDRFDPEHRSFLNINTVEELANVWVTIYSELSDGLSTDLRAD